MKAAIVIPAYNEAASIAGVVASVKECGKVIVVDDGSSDDTSARAKAAGAVVVTHATNRGYDAALASGFNEAERLGAQAIVTFDADGQLEAAAVGAGLSALDDGESQFVLGERDSGAARISEHLFNLYTRVRFGVSDILCGLKGFRTNAVVMHRGCLETSSVNTALALALLRNGVPFTSIPVKVAPREGQSRYGGFWRANIRISRALAQAFMDDFLRR
jgi:glycosyltransferase involved in cell wall biosynthesis